jgi:hypothetical protein
MAPADRFAVEEHVHACHVCAVELARAEHEVMRLRRGYAEVRRAEAATTKGPRPGFAARVVQRLIDEEGSEANETGRESADTALRLSRLAHQRSRLAAPLWLAAAAMMLFVVSGTVALLFREQDRAPEHTARLVVMRASDAYGSRGRRLGSGDGLGESQILSVGDGGAALVDWHDRSNETQPAATLAVHGNGQVRLELGAPLLMHGSVQVETHRRVAIPVADGNHIELGIGEYMISVATVPLDNESYAPEVRDPLSSAPDDLRIEVEVLRGDVARIVRSDVGPTLVAAGQVGIYEGGGATIVQPAGAGGSNVAVASFGSRVAAPTSDHELGTLSATVLERTGLPSVGTHVIAQYVTANGYRIEGGDTNAYGNLVLSCGDSPCTSNFAILHAIPAGSERGTVAPDAFPFLRDGKHASATRSLVVDGSLPLTGEVLDELGTRPVGVRVLACVVDDVFGTVFPLVGQVAYTDLDGRFTARRLPATLPQHQHLVLVFAHPLLRPLAVPIPPRGTYEGQPPMPPIVMRKLRTVRLEGLGQNTQVKIWEEVPNMPGGRMAWQRTFETDYSGAVNLAAVGSGDLWWVTGNTNVQVCRLTGQNTLSPGSGQPSSDQWSPMAALDGTDLLIGTSFRHQQMVLPNGQATGQTLVARDAENRPVAEAQVFIVSPTGPRGSLDPKFLGFTTSAGAISLASVPNGSELLVIGSDGSVGTIDNVGQGPIELVTVLQRPGGVRIMPSLRPDPTSGVAVLSLRFERIGPLPKAKTVRFACEANNWEASRLMPGLYTVRIGDVVRPVFVQPNQVVELE